MLTLSELTRDYLDPFGVWVGLIIAIPIFWTWYDLVWGRKKRHKKWLRQAIDSKGKNPVVLIIDLLAGKDIKAAVKAFMAGNDRLKSIPDERIISVVRDRDLVPEDMPALAREIQDAIGSVLQHGPDELNVFLAGPGCASSMVGAELSNINCKVFLFQNDRASNAYVNFGLLRHPRF